MTEQELRDNAMRTAVRQLADAFERVERDRPANEPQVRPVSRKRVCERFGGDNGQSDK